MTQKTTKELLEESRSLRFSFKKPDAVADSLIEQTFSPLPWNYYFGQVLGAVGFSFADCIFHIYFDEEPNRSWDGDPDITIILHGHNRSEHCATKTLCHVLGYKLDRPLPPLLQKQWEKFGYD